MMSRKLSVTLLALAALAAAQVAQAASIVVGTHTLLPNTPGQVIDIVGTGGEALGGMNFYASVGDGGPDLGGADLLPLMSSVDIIGAGTIFGANNTGQIGGSFVTGSFGQDIGPGLYAAANTTTSSGSVPFAGVIARLTIDTTGIQAGANDILIPLRVTWPPGNPLGDAPTKVVLAANANEIVPDIVNGFIRIEAEVATNDPPEYSYAPPPGSTLGPGDIVTVANAPASPPRGRDDGSVSNVVLTQGADGTFSIAPLAGGSLAAGSARTAMVGFDDSGLLNGLAVSGALDFQTDGGNGGPVHYNLQATASGNSGDQSARIGAGGSYAGLSGSSPATGGVAELLAGTHLGEGTTARMVWRNRNANEGGSTGDTGTTPPLPAFATSLLTDVVSMTGADGDTIVLQMSYDESLLNTTEADALSKGILYLASFNPSTGMWENAVSQNHGANTGAGGVIGPWSGQMDLGAWGVDPGSNRAWAVVDHNSEFGVVPEPSTLLLAGLGILLVAAVGRRARRA